MIASRLRVVRVIAVAMASMQLVGAFTVPSQSRYFRSLRHHDAMFESRAQYAAPENHEQRQFWTLPRLYVGQSRNMRNKRALSTGAMIHLLPEQAHYLVKVMRIMSSRRITNRQQPRSTDCAADNEARIRIFNGIDGEWLAKVHALTSRDDEYSESLKKRGKKVVRSPNERRGGDSLVAECIIQLRAQDYNDDDRPWIMFVPLKKQPRMKIIIEKCTELGVGRLIPVASDRMEGEASISLLGSSGNDSQNNNDLRIDKLELQSIEASEQCERLGIPMITCDMGLSLCGKLNGDLWKVRDVVENWCREWEAQKETNGVAKLGDQNDTLGMTTKQNARRVLLICRERGSGEDTVPVLKALHVNKKASFLVGPEGGWSANEEKLFDEICSKYAGQDETPVRCVSLGISVLRAETACLMAVGAWMLTETSEQN